MIEEIKIMVSNLSLKEGDIIIVDIYGNSINSTFKAKLNNFSKVIDHNMILIGENTPIKNFSIADDERLKELGVMRIPKKETKIGS